MHWTDFDAILFDIDGTLWREGAALPGARDVVNYLRAQHIRTACITNNSAHTAADIASALHHQDVCVPPEAVYTSGQAMADMIVAHGQTLGRKPRVFNFAGHALPVELAGRAEFVDHTHEPCDVVAVATHVRENNVPFNFPRALIGLNLLRQGAMLLAGCADRVFPVSDPEVRTEFGSGSWAALFSYGAALPPDRIRFAGKPEADFFLNLCRRIDVPPHRCLLIGDNLESDIQGGRRVGMATILLLTGVTREAEIAASPHQPTRVMASLTEVLQTLSA